MSALKKLPRFLIEAQAIAERERLPADAVWAVRADLLKKSCVEESAPYVAQLVAIRRLCVPRFALVNGNLEKLDDGIPDSLKPAVAGLEEHIALIHQKHAAEAVAT